MLDGEVSCPEVTLLVDWFDANPEAALSYPGNVLARRLERIMEDGVVDDEEREDLGELLAELTGASHGRIIGANAATTLPIDHPQPELVFDGSLWVFTGKMAFGPRELCEQEVRVRGARCAATVTQSTDYLVIGTIGSRDWYHTTHGRKIEQAVDMRERGIPIAIISEDHWAAALDRAV
jgi:NAD-dependent DNA ligase